MIIVLSETSPPRLEDAANFKAFKVSAPASIQTEAALGAALGPAGRPAGVTDAFIDPAWLRAQAPRDDRDWPGQLEGMIGYARTKGWLADDGAIQAHVETV